MVSVGKRGQRCPPWPWHRPNDAYRTGFSVLVQVRPARNQLKSFFCGRPHAQRSRLRSRLGAFFRSDLSEFLFPLLSHLHLRRHLVRLPPPLMPRLFRILLLQGPLNFSGPLNRRTRTKKCWSQRCPTLLRQKDFPLELCLSDKWISNGFQVDGRIFTSNGYFCLFYALWADYKIYSTLWYIVVTKHNANGLQRLIFIHAQ
jgi:hypothetical protein